MHPLAPWGWDARWADALRASAPLQPVPADGSFEPGRVLEIHRERIVVVTRDGEMPAELPGRAFRDVRTALDLPAVGDFVALDVTRPGGRALIRSVLPRRTALLRRQAGRARRVAHRDADIEVILSNLDSVLVLTSLNADFSPRRVERWLAQIWEGGAQPVVVLTKSDLSDDVDARVAETMAVAPGVPVIPVSGLRHKGLDALAPYFARGRTAALVGSSGVGKSTLVNVILGRDVQYVREIRAHDDTGMHTTTSRRILLVPDGGCLVDTPGMRELGLFDSEGGVVAAFPEISDLAGRCRFRDCAHDHEPGCAVREAVGAGGLPPDRLDGFHQLRRELAFVAAKEHRRARALDRGTGRPEAARSRGEEDA